MNIFLKFLKKKNIAWLLAIIFILASGGFYFYKNNAYAGIYDPNSGTGDNISGFAWNSNFGWISTNSTDCDVDGDRTYEGLNEGNPAGSTPAPAGCPSGVAFFDYGVKLDMISGNFSGYGWNSNFGWVSFAPAGPYPQAPNYSAKYELGDVGPDKRITGWAKILSLGDEGWVSMNGASWGVTMNSVTGKFNGWAWNGSDKQQGSGWISFSSDTAGSGGGSYGVVAQLPQIFAKNLSAPNWGGISPCDFGALHARLKWEFTHPNPAAIGSAYRVILKRASDNSVALDTGKCTALNTCTENCGLNPGGSKCKIDLSCLATGRVCTYDLAANELEYLKSYKWSVTVWDNTSVSSVVNFSTLTSGHVLTDNVAANTANNPVDPELSFTTYSHEYPVAGFTWVPVKPSANEKVVFSDASSYSNYDTPTVDKDATCGVGGYNCTWKWTVNEYANILGLDNLESADIKFNQSGSSAIVGLTVTDDDGYSCSTSTSMFGIQAELPEWEESR